MTTDNSNELRAKLLKKLKGLEGFIGCSTEELLTVLAIEIGARLPQQQPIDADAIVNEVVKKLPGLLPDFNSVAERIRVAIETKVAGKLDEVMGLVTKGMKDNVPDTQSIIQGVAALLQPKIAEASQLAAQKVFEANFEALKKGIDESMQARYEQLRQQGAVMDPNAAPSAGAKPSLASGILGMAMSNPEGLKGLAEALKAVIEVFRPAAPAPNAMLADFNKYLGFHDLMTKIEKRVVTGDEIGKQFTSIFGGAGQAQTPPAAQT